MLLLAAAQVLFTSGVKDAETGRLERARLTLQTLLNTFPNDPLAPDAKAQIGAIDLYQEGQQRVKEGRYAAAIFTFQTLLSVYPESPLGKQAQAAIQEAARSEEELNVRLVVHDVQVEGFELSGDEAQRFLAEREVRLSAGKPFDPRDVDQARIALTALTGSPVRAEVRTAGAHQVDILLARAR